MTYLRGLKVVASAVACMLILPATGNGFDAKFTPLGDLPGGAFASYARDVSADGSIVVGAGTNDIPSDLPGGYRFEAVQWTATGGLVGLGTALSQRGTSASAVSGDGNVIGGFIFDAYPDRSVFTQTGDSNMSRASGCDCVEFDSLSALSHDGSVHVGRMYFHDGARAYRWTQTTGAIDLGVLLGGGQSSASDVTPDGSVVVGTSGASRFFHAFRWTEDGGMQDIGVGLGPLNASSDASAISDDGSIIVGQWKNRAVRWIDSNGTLTAESLGALPGSTQSYAIDISGDGQVIVGATMVNGTWDAFRWTQQSGMRSMKSILSELGLDMNDWRLFYPNAASADGGVIVGDGINPAGQVEGWIAHIPPNYVPEPASFGLLLLAIGWAIVLTGVHHPR